MQRAPALTVLTLCSVLALPLSAAPLQTEQERVEAPPERAFSAFSTDPARQFDFWIGSWDVNLRMQQEDLSFRDTIQSRADIYGILDGKAVLELWDSSPIKGYSLRYFDPSKGQWVLWLDWPNQNRSSISSLEGEFRHGRGEFYSSFETPEGMEITQRYSFNDITPFSLRWDDLVSRDGGKTWSKNWVMEWTRLAVDPVWPIDRNEVPTFETGQRCSHEAFRPYEAIIGSWQGDGAALEAYRILDGCAVMAFATLGERKEFLFLTYLGEQGGWETNVLDDRPETPLVRYAGESAWTNLSAGDGERLEWSLEEDLLIYRRGEREVRFERER